MKLFTNKKILIAFLVVVMVASTSFSFTYWLQGLKGSSTTNSDLNIVVGSGNHINSTITATRDASANINVGKKLIPFNKASLIDTGAPIGPEDDIAFLYDGDDYATSITFGFNVRWSYSYETQNYKNLKGAFEVVYRIFLGDKDVTNDVGLNFNTRKLFQLDFTAPAEIGQDVDIPVVFTLEMDEPANKAQYEDVTNPAKGLRIEIDFNVTTIYDVQG